jgi:hypothetical protein
MRNFNAHLKSLKTRNSGDASLENWGREVPRGRRIEEEDEDERTRTKKGTKEQIAAGTKKRQNLRDDRTNQWSLTEYRHITPHPPHPSKRSSLEIFLKKMLKIVFQEK